MAQRSLLTCEAGEALAQENQRIWEVYYLPRPLSESWATWRAWLDEYRELVRNMQDMYEEHHGRKHNDRRLTQEAAEQSTHTP